MARNKTRKTPTGQSNERLYGKHSVKSTVLVRPKDVSRIIIAGKEEYHADLVELAQSRNIDVFMVSWPEFLQMGRFGADDSHQGVMAFVAPRRIFTEADFARLQKAKCVMVLDQVSNPQNLATIIRSAAFFRANAVLYMKNRAATPTPEVARFAVGGAEMVDLYCITNVAQVLDQLSRMGFAVLGLDERGERALSDISMEQQIAFVVGAEGEGLRQKTREHCTELVRIPGGRRGLESLNAGVAATIALYEKVRKQNAPAPNSEE